MKKILAYFLLFCISMMNAYAGKVEKIVFFGDSLTDTGNLYNLTLHYIPKSPPYYAGRFSNGPTWADNVSDFYAKKSHIESKIYAVGGATALYHPPKPDFIAPSNLDLQVHGYLFESTFQDKDKTLFVIWIGANDYLFDRDADIDKVTDKVINKIHWAIEILKDNGAKHFLILNLPDLAQIPDVLGGNTESKMHKFSTLNNEKLDEMVKKIQLISSDVSIKQVNIYDLFVDVIANPEEYNKKYNLHITNTANACWNGGYTFTKNLSSPVLAREIERDFTAQNIKVPNNFDVKTLSALIAASPELSYTYQLARSFKDGNVPCTNPDEHLFWDSVHPTKIAHQILAEIVIDKLGDSLS